MNHLFYFPQPLEWLILFAKFVEKISCGRQTFKYLSFVESILLRNVLMINNYPKSLIQKEEVKAT